MYVIENYIINLWKATQEHRYDIQYQKKIYKDEEDRSGVSLIVDYKCLWRKTKKAQKRMDQQFQIAFLDSVAASSCVCEQIHSIAVNSLNSKTCSIYTFSLNFSIPGFVLFKLEKDLFKTMNWLAVVLWWQNAIAIVLLRVFGLRIQKLLTYAIELNFERLVVALICRLVEDLIIVNLAVRSDLFIITNINIFLNFTLLVERFESQKVVGVVENFLSPNAVVEWWLRAAILCCLGRVN